MVIDDYTTEKNLKALITKEPPQKDFIVSAESLVGLSVDQFWEKYMQDDAELGIHKFLATRDIIDIDFGKWEEATGDDITILGMTAKKKRVATFTAQVKNNPLVKVVPTRKTYYLIEHTPTKLHIIQKNKTSDAPYCDTFQILEEWIILSPDPAS